MKENKELELLKWKYNHSNNIASLWLNYSLGIVAFLVSAIIVCHDIGYAPYRFIILLIIVFIVCLFSILKSEKNQRKTEKLNDKIIIMMKEDINKEKQKIC